MRWTPKQLEAYLNRHKPPWVVPEWCVKDDEPDPGPESVLQRKIEAWALEWGRPCLSFRQGKWAKRNIPAGWADIEIIMPHGKTLRIELKSSTGRLSEEQKRLKLQFMSLGHEVHECRSYKRFLEIVKNDTQGPKKA